MGANEESRQYKCPNVSLGACSNSLDLKSNYSSTDDENEEGGGRAIPGPQVKTSTPNSLRLSRRTTPNANMISSHRHSASMTPPPCLLRKIRRGMSVDRNPNPVLDMDESWKRASSGSSLSTLIGEISPHFQNASSTNSSKSKLNFYHNDNNAYFSLQRPIGRHSGKLSKNLEDNSQNNSIFAPHPEVNFNPYETQICKNEGKDKKGAKNEAKNEIQNEEELRIGLNFDSIRSDIEVLSEETRRLDMDMSCIRGNVSSVQENISHLRSTVDTTREKVIRLGTTLSNAERQISNAVKEANGMREEVLKLLESTQMSKRTQEQLTEETQNILNFLRHILPQKNNPGLTNSSKKSQNFNHTHHSCCSSATNSQNSPQGNSMAKNKIFIERALDCIPESPSFVSVSEIYEKKNEKNKDNSESSGDDLSLSDNDSIVSVHKSEYHKG